MTAKEKNFSGRRNNHFFLVLSLFLFPAILIAQSQTALNSYKSGLSFYNTKQFNQAESAFKEAITNDPTFAEPHYDLGLYYEEVAFDFEKAIEHFTRNIRLRGTKANDSRKEIQKISTLKVKFPPHRLPQIQKSLSTYNAAVKDIDKKNYSLAISKLNSTLSVIPFYIDALYGRGLAHYQQRNFHLAMKDLELVHFFDPAYKDIKYYLAVTYDLFSSKSKEATSLYRSYLLKTDLPDDRRKVVQNILFNIEKIEEIKSKAYAEFQNGNIDKAELLYKDALNIRPNDIIVLNNMGFMLMQKKNYPSAEQYFLQAKNINPYDPNPYYNLACLYSIKKDKTTALAFFRVALPYMSENMKKHALGDEDLSFIHEEIKPLLFTP